ncbi:MAG TPA: hypothetical protein PKL65_03945 [Bacteroidales bacterium]|nr:hypothetical protein [Bacteroidales bacterium]HNR41361.1 hypothetical protein [Bacteroidales bacterium]HPM17486.1 hypothetical protein [Bacteroidales bacterium]HQH24675.1 hypothetical protein [Bacteroidales bacterium]
MKKTVLLFISILLLGTTTVTNAQKDRALSNGFSIHLIGGLPSGNFGLEKDAHIDKKFKLNPLMGFQIGNRWYFTPGERFRAGLMVNWFDLTFAFKTTSTDSFDWSRYVADVAVLELGPVATFKIANNMAVDGYYNLRPSGFATMFVTNLFGEDESDTYSGGGISHAIGGAFRWNILSVGAEYVLGGIKCKNIDPESDDTSSKLLVNSVRIMVGVKF